MSDPFKIIEPTVISFSGGRTSAYMLWRVLQSNNGLPSDAIVCFANTGKEEEATLKFVNDCSVNWNVPIHWVEYISEEPKFKVVNFNNASRNGEPFEAVIKHKKYLPNPVTRYCSIELKIRTISKYCKSLGLDVGENDAWVGIRADEPRRAAKISRDRVPLVTDQVTKEIIGKFWANNNFDLGLSNNNGVTPNGNCDLCFLKSKIPSLIKEKPERAIWWINMENLANDICNMESGKKFRLDKPSYKQIHKFVTDQTELFDLFDEGENIPCFCGD
jgi:3'-phosphoadenosine 5'-phosphosulfate sulfotransferase (PAPS reductase)/FAD synthetase